MENVNFSDIARGKTALVLHPKDNVGVALADVRAGDSVTVRGDSGDPYGVVVAEDVAFGHKFALGELSADAPVYKYGEEIGRTKSRVVAGGWIHVHNMYCDRGMK
ncbi:MAG: UxaA family hydrolase [Synergistaceae bacterium]|nr:UxaA family hydrolase [Synergistaceae bacterium]